MAITAAFSLRPSIARSNLLVVQCGPNDSGPAPFPAWRGAHSDTDWFSDFPRESEGPLALDADGFDRGNLDYFGSKGSKVVVDPRPGTYMCRALCVYKERLRSN